MNQLRIGLVGAGVIGSVHSLMLREIANALPGRVDLVAVADPDAAARANARNNYGYREEYGDACELLAHADINAIFVCTPTRFHHEIVLAAAARGVHVFCEKPLAMSYAEGVEMRAALAAGGCRAQIGLVLRFSAVYTAMRQMLADPAAGRPLAIVFRDDQCFPTRGMHASPWRADRSLSAGGTLIEHGVHDLDLLTWMFGPIVRLRAWERNLAGHPGIEDYVAVEAEFADGLRAQLVNLWHDMLQRPSNRRLEIFCERAFISSDHDMHGPITRQSGDGEAEIVSADAVLQRFIDARGAAEHPQRDWFPVSYFVQDLAFVEALLADRDPEPGIGVGLEAQRLAEAVYTSARENREIELDAFEPNR